MRRGPEDGEDGAARGSRETEGDANVHCDEKGRAALPPPWRGRACEAKLDRLESINDLSRAQATDDEGPSPKRPTAFATKAAARSGSARRRTRRPAVPSKEERDDAERAKACDGLEAKFQKRAQGQSADEAEELGQLADLPIVYDDGKGIAAPGQVQTNDQAKKTITAKECPNFDRFEALVADKKARETAIEEKRKACEAAGEKAALALDASNVPSDCENRAAVEADVRRAKAACAKDWAKFKRLHDGAPEAETRADFATDFAESRCPPSDQDLDEYLEAQQRAAAKRKERDDAQRAKACEA